MMPFARIRSRPIARTRSAPAKLGFPDPAVSTGFVHQLLSALSNIVGAASPPLISMRRPPSAHGSARRSSSAPRPSGQSCLPARRPRPWLRCWKPARSGTGAASDSRKTETRHPAVRDRPRASRTHVNAHMGDRASKDGGPSPFEARWRSHLRVTGLSFTRAALSPSKRNRARLSHRRHSKFSSAILDSHLGRLYLCKCY